jgi:SAM-dependent methyltransferase
LIFRCPSCLRGTISLAEIDAAGWACPSCEEISASIDGIPNGLNAERQVYFEKFCAEYLKIRNAEDCDTDDPEHYRARKARSVRFFEKSILKRLTVEAAKPLKILDAGAGNGWLSNRVRKLGHEPVALDLLTDPRHGLGACRHYDDRAGRAFTAVRGEFEEIPLADDQFDLVVFIEAFHYATDYWRALHEARRCLHWGGRVVIIDTPIFTNWSDGEAAVEDRHRETERSHGFRADSVPSMGYLSLDMLQRLGRDLNIEWHFHRPWYGWGEYLETIRSRLPGGSHEAMRWIVEGSWPTAVT